MTFWCPILARSCLFGKDALCWLVYTRAYCLCSIALFFLVSSLLGAFSGLLAGAIESMDGPGGKPGWAWIFIPSIPVELAFVYVTSAVFIS